ncbi:MAG: ATP-binding protein [Ruminococcus sp.]|nr:ATP-binding protein [Ruminococcus sp.]
MNQIAFQKALREVANRRLKAKIENEQRCQEIDKKIPEIAQINQYLAQTVMRIMRGEDIESVERQNIQAQQNCQKLLKKNGYSIDYLDLHYTCQKCNDTGYINNGQYCTCLEKLVAKFAIEEMNQNTQLTLCSFEQFSLAYYQNHKCYADMAMILGKCQKYAMNFNMNSPSLLFQGDVGTGKTHLSLSIVTEVLKQGYAVIYDSIGNLLSKIENEHFKNNTSQQDTLDLLLHADLLVLDDLGTEFRSSFISSIMYTIVNTRINKGLPTIISTNLDGDEIYDSYEKRLISRLFSIYEVIPFNGIDIRQEKKRLREAKRESLI